MLPQTNNSMQAYIAPTVVTMTSMEISDLVESRHDSVKRAIERLANQGVITLPPLVEVSNAGPGPKMVAVYQFSAEKGKRDSIIVVAQLSPEFTAALVDRWQAIEKLLSPTLPDFSNPAIAARAWADQVEANQIAVLQLEMAKPAVQFVDKYVDSTGLKAFREVCKILQANESRFREFLADSKIMYRLNGTWVPYQNHIEAGRLSVKTGVANHNGHAFTDVKFTPKGINWVAGEWAKHQIQAEVA